MSRLLHLVKPHRRHWLRVPLLDQPHRRQSPDLASMPARLALPQTRPRPVSQLPQLLWRSDVDLVVFDVGQSADGCHARLHEPKLLLGRQLHNDSVVELPHDRCEGSSSMDVVEVGSGESLNAMHERSDWKRSQRVRIAIFRSDGDSRDELRGFDEVAGLHVHRRQNVLHLITDSDERDVRCSTAAFDDLQHLLDLHFSLARWTVAMPFHPVIPESG